MPPSLFCRSLGALRAGGALELCFRRWPRFTHKENRLFLSDLSWDRDQEAASRARVSWLPGNGARPGPRDLQVLISNLVIGNRRPAAGIPRSANRAAVLQGGSFVPIWVSPSEQLLCGRPGASAAQGTGRARRRGRGRRKARPRTVNRVITREPEKLHQDLGAELAQFQKDLLAPPIDQPVICTGYTEMN